MTDGLAYSQRFLVWVVALAASVETVFNAVTSAMQGHTRVAVVWFVATAIVLPLAALAERVKISGGE